MPKLEQKLIELGYSEWCYSLEYKTYIKVYNHESDLNINVTNSKDKIIDWYVYVEEFTFKKQERINDIQQAFNQLQNDLEVLKEYE